MTKKETYVIPEFALPYMVNGDKDNLTDTEILEIDRFLSVIRKGYKDNVIGHISESAYFHWRNDIFGMIGANCYDVEIITYN